MDNFTKLKRLIFGAITNKVDESFAMTMSSYFIKKLSNPQFKSAIVFALSKNPDIIDSLNKANADIVRKTTQIIVREITPPKPGTILTWLSATAPRRCKAMVSDEEIRDSESKED